VSFAAITLCVASQRVFIFVVVAAVVYFVIDSVRKILDTPS
jgi:ABC-type arginine transport system permease subunit